jgi:galactonate dehydratase
MKIERVEVFPLVLSPEQVSDSYATSASNAEALHGYIIKPPWRSIYAPGNETLLVKITAEDGTAGWGEALAPVAPHIAAAIIERLMAPFIIGTDTDDQAVIRHRLSESMRERGHLSGHQADALAAIDIALWDLRGKIAGRSVSELLGGARRTTVPSYISGFTGSSDAEVAQAAADFAAAGGSRIKLHLGRGVAADLATFDAVQASAPDAQIAVDAHWSYGEGEARRLGRGLDERGAWFFEAPLAPEDRAGHAALAQFLATPVAVGEAMRSRYEFADWLQARAVGAVQPDVGRTGISEALDIGTIAGAFHVPIAPHHSAALGVALAAGLHVAATAQNLLSFEFQPTLLRVANLILRKPIAMAGADALQLPTAPGLGVEVDEDALRVLLDGGTI